MGGRIYAESLEFTLEILASIAAIDEFKGAWQSIGRIAPKRLSALRRLATIESIGSSTRSEGAALTNRVVEHLFANLDIRAFTSRDETEVAGYAAVMETVLERNRSLRRPHPSTVPRPPSVLGKGRAASRGVQDTSQRRRGDRT